MHSMVPDGFFGTKCPGERVTDLKKCSDCKHAFTHYSNPNGLPCRVCSQNNLYERKRKFPSYNIYGVSLGGVPEIKDVIFNPPATIVNWSDNTKTVVKIQDDDVFDPEKGLVMAIAKKAMGNTGSYFNHIKKWVKKYEDSTMVNITVNLAPNSFMAALWAANKELEDKIRACGSDTK